MVNPSVLKTGRVDGARYRIQMYGSGGPIKAYIQYVDAEQRPYWHQIKDESTLARAVYAVLTNPEGDQP
jgi:hypothetical protein